MVYELRMRSRSPDWNQWLEIIKQKHLLQWEAAAIVCAASLIHVCNGPEFFQEPQGVLWSVWETVYHCQQSCLKCQVLPWKEGQGWVYFMFDPLSVTGWCQKGTKDESTTFSNVKSGCACMETKKWYLWEGKKKLNRTFPMYNKIKDETVDIGRKPTVWLPAQVTLWWTRSYSWEMSQDKNHISKWSCVCY